MSRLHTRILLALTAIAAVYFFVSSWIQRTALLPSFATLERQQALADLGRAQEAIAKELEHVGNFVNDWSGWDDTYQYLADANQTYFDSNLAHDVFRRDSFDFLTFVRLDGTEVWRGAMVEDASIDLPELPSPWPLDHPLLQPRVAADEAAGLLLTGHGPLLVASRIVTDSGRTAPRRGWVMMGRLLDEARCRQLAEQTRLDLRLCRVDELRDARRQASLRTLAAGAEHDLDLADDDLALAASLLRQLDGEPGLFLEVAVPRRIVAEGRAALRVAELSTLLAVLVLFAGVFWLLRRGVVGPLSDLTRHTLRIHRTDDLTLRCSSGRRDEIGALSREFDRMVARLAASRAAKIEQARAGGKAEVAAEVLHDIGNIMQSLTTARGELAELLRGRVLTDLERLQALLEPHRDELPQWLHDDPRGRKVPPFLLALLPAVLQDRDAMQEQVATIDRGLQHVHGLLARQHGHTGHRGVAERVALPELLAEARRIAVGPDGAIEVTLQAPDHEVEVERHRLTAVLVNLLRNAAEASRPDHRLHVQVCAELHGERLCIAVRDDGCGIAPADLEAIFARGFTTKGDGHGVGLHSCATTLGELGGTIRASSRGPGTGACFELELPVRRPASQLAESAR